MEHFDTSFEGFKKTQETKEKAGMFLQRMCKKLEKGLSATNSASLDTTSESSSHDSSRETEQFYEQNDHRREKSNKLKQGLKRLTKAIEQQCEDRLGIVQNILNTQYTDTAYEDWKARCSLTKEQLKLVETYRDFKKKALELGSDMVRDKDFFSRVVRTFDKMLGTKLGNDIFTTADRQKSQEKFESYIRILRKVERMFSESSSSILERGDNSLEENSNPDSQFAQLQKFEPIEPLDASSSLETVRDVFNRQVEKVNAYMRSLDKRQSIFNDDGRKAVADRLTRIAEKFSGQTIQEYGNKAIEVLNDFHKYGLDKAENPLEFAKKHDDHEELLNILKNKKNYIEGFYVYLKEIKKFEEQLKKAVNDALDGKLLPNNNLSPLIDPDRALKYLQNSLLYPQLEKVEENAKVLYSNTLNLLVDRANKTIDQIKQYVGVLSQNSMNVITKQEDISLKLAIIASFNRSISVFEDDFTNLNKAFNKIKSLPEFANPTLIMEAFKQVEECITRLEYGYKEREEFINKDNNL